MTDSRCRAATLLLLALTAPTGTVAAELIEELVVRPATGRDGSLILSSAREFSPPASLTDLLKSSPDVSLVGQGGRLQTFAVRGLSKERVRVLFNDAPIRSLRRAGVSAAFLNPAWMSVATDASAGAVRQGSGAIGGVVYTAPLDAPSGRLAMSYEGPGSFQSVDLNTRGEDWQAALAYAQQDDQSAPDGTRLNTSFEQLSALLTRRYSVGDLDAASTLLYADGRDLGKSNSNFPERVASYPLDRHLFLSQELSAAGLGRANGWLHAQRLETKTLRDGVRADVETSVVDYGLRLEHELQASARRHVSWGVDLMGRGNYEVEEGDAKTVDDGSELELGAYIDAEERLGTWNLGAGARVVYGRADAAGRRSYDSSELVGHLTAGRRRSEHFGWSFTLHRGTTLPTVSQLFFSGTTGRGSVIGNEALDAEDAWVYELTGSGQTRGLRWLLRAYFMDIDSFIEKLPLAEDVDTFVNTDGGEIYGLTGEVSREFGSVLLEAGFATLRGELDNGDNIRDVPADRLTLRASWPAPLGDLGLELAQRFRGRNVASGNRREDARTLVSASLRRTLGDHWQATLFARNLLDELYLVSGDDQAPLGPERTFGVSLSRQI